ncbi:MAG: DUF92 domain-containing protein [Vulcanimicrobiaceae bacterium]
MQPTLAPLTNFDIGALAATTIAIAAYRTRSLDLGGALAAVAVGTATVGALGAPGAAVLLVFFITSVALSRVGKRRKAILLADVDKTGARDGAQVLANGGVAAVCALVALWVDARFAIAFAGAFAAATADTWGTEIGTLARGRPRSILGFRPIATGLSGGVTVVGTLAEIAGASLIAGVAIAVRVGTATGTRGAPATTNLVRDALAIALGGVAGALVDSVLGASVQSLRWCPQCKRPTEREPHACGANTAPVRGLPWFGNDAVNFAATLVGAGVALALAP